MSAEKVRMTEEEAAWFAQAFQRLAGNIEHAVVGKPLAVRLALTCLLSEGHLLLEDVPGTGKTSLARAIAKTVAGTESRIQFTPDLLPSDVTGGEILDQRTNEFSFRQGPIFANIVLADEINRASPKTQSALLEAMEERRVTVGRKTRDLELPFMVIATQNPIEQAGTYPLPEAQLDRFLMKTGLGAPDHDTTVGLLAESSVRDRTAGLTPVISANAARDMANLASRVHTDPAILDYVTRLVEQTRRAPDVLLGASMRGALAWIRTAKTWAASGGRSYVIPDDIKALAEPILSHRLILTVDAEFAGSKPEDIVRRVVGEVAPPAERGAQ